MISFRRIYRRIKLFLGEKHYCPRRRESPLGARSKEKNPDRWIKTGPNRTCSYCGSIHPDDFEMILDKTISKEIGYYVEPSTKNYKIYVRQPNVENASQGGIKFYTVHCPFDDKKDGWFRRVNKKYKMALGK